MYGERQDGSLPLGAFYTINVDTTVWQHVESIWYRPIDPPAIARRNPNARVVEQYIDSIESGNSFRLSSGTLITWEPVPLSEASLLPTPRQ